MIPVRAGDSLIIPRSEIFPEDIEESSIMLAGNSIFCLNDPA